MHPDEVVLDINKLIRDSQFHTLLLTMSMVSEFPCKALDSFGHGQHDWQRHTHWLVLKCPRCLTRDATRLRRETVEAATRIVLKTEVGDHGTGDPLRFPPAVTETETENEIEGEGDTDKREAMHVQGGMFESPMSVALCQTICFVDAFRYCGVMLGAMLRVWHWVPLEVICTSLLCIIRIRWCPCSLSRSFDNRSAERRPFDRRYCDGYRRLDHSRERDRDREREPHAAADTYYPRDFTATMYDYRRGREREREESYRRKGSRRKHKRRRRRTRSYSPSSSVSTAQPELVS